MLTLSQNGDGRDLPHRRVYEESFRTNSQTRRDLWRSITKNNVCSYHCRVVIDLHKSLRVWLLVLEQQKNWKKKKQQKEWYANNRTQQIDKAKKWNKDNQSARKLIVERHKQKKGNSWQWTSQKNK